MKQNQIYELTYYINKSSSLGEVGSYELAKKIEPYIDSLIKETLMVEIKPYLEPIVSDLVGQALKPYVKAGDCLD